MCDWEAAAVLIAMYLLFVGGGVVILGSLYDDYWNRRRQSRLDKKSKPE